jgi:transketolase
MALHGGVLPVGGTFFVFADYMRPAIRLAALSKARCVFVFSHDSVGVGEDGPTHQPIEQLASLRAIPGLHVVRPADPEETRAAWIDAITHDGPTALVLSRQTVPALTDGTAVHRGAGILVTHDDAEAVVVATGSEVSIALAAHDKLLEAGVSVSVVSMPSWDRFDGQDEDYKDEVLPPHLPVVSIEAGTTFGWHQWADSAIGIDRFGASAPGATVMAKLGISADAVVTAVHELLDV